ncbi:heme-binding domain-containing protein [Flavobacterium sp.]|uniref:heme-binding domain-containing protein n=1 Tax=Flavobacterium sp. TaxID=239 RepID=UPI003526CDED
MKKFLIGLVALLVVIQLFQIDKTNPVVDKNLDFINSYKPSPEIAQQIRTSCYDCHSNDTEYPFYSNIQPFGWFLANHIKEGRSHLNFSEFGTYTVKKQAHKLEEAVELIEKNEMPLSSYTSMHSSAALSDAQKKMLIEYFRAKQAEIKSSLSIQQTDAETEE